MLRAMVEISLPGAIRCGPQVGAMPGYSIRYLDLLGRLQPSDFMPFKNDNVATEYARSGLERHATVEVWKKNELVVRLHRPPAGDPAQPVAVPIVATMAPPAHRPAPDPSNPAVTSPQIVVLHAYNRPVR